MEARYFYDEKKKPKGNSSGYGYILDSCPEVSWDDNLATVFGRKEATKIVDALNLKEELSRLKKGATKKELITILNKYKINI